MGMKNHELVPLPLVSSIAAIHRGATSRIINDLTRTRLVVYERGKRCMEGFFH
jgi:RIO kinase 2